MSLKSWVATKAVSFLASNNRTEGWEQSLDRRRPNPQLVSSDTEYNFGNREKMMAEARALCQTFGITNNILGKFANYCVGSCEVDWDTGDTNWDEAAEEGFKVYSKMVDVAGEHDLSSMAKLGLRSKKRDGDVGFIKTKENGWPQLQAIEGDRIRTAAFPFNSDTEKGLIGGITLSKVGRPSSFRVWERMIWFGFENPREVPAESFIFWKEKRRFDGARGITALEAGALNRMRDIKEILQAESKAVKSTSKWAILVKRLMGGQRTAGLGVFTKSDGNTVAAEDIPDGLIKYLLPGEEAAGFQSNRPSPTFTGFLEFLIRDIAVSLELPVSFVWSMLGLTGPAVRLESKQAEKTFLAEIEDMERSFLNPFASWWVNWAMLEAKILPFNPNWYRFEFNRPSHPSIDVGRESKADLDELAACVTSEVDLASARGTNAYKVARKKARFQKFLVELADEFDVPLDRLQEPPKVAVPPQPGDPAAEPGNNKEAA